ncbi:sensor domain-containing protein [Aliidiomarina celeris]|uniref:sensor domain-containing protein n=1 Tax=Aliidiomarina celeris TaxID=2249428 RepID=UPI000DEAF86C|nr:sensor domain-containing diguanylate cyclase [Aliidiomarina celeris]
MKQTKAGTSSHITRQRNLEQERAAAVLYTMFIHNDEPVANWVSDNLTEITGWSREQAIQPGWWSAHIHPDDQKVEAQANDDLLSQGYLTYEYRFQFADGSYHWIRDEMRVLRDPSSTDIQILGVWRDVSQERAMNTLLHQQNERLQLFTQNVPGMLYEFVLEPDGRMYFPFASDRIQDIYGVTAAQAREDAFNAAQNIHPDDLDEVLRTINASAEQLTIWRLEYRVKFADTERWLRGEAHPARKANGATVWHGYIMDITNEKKAERELRLASSVFEHTHEGIMITDPNDIIIEVNPTFTRITGYSREEAVGQPGRFMASGHHDEAFLQDIWRNLKQHGFWQGEIWNRNKRGEIYCERKTISAVHDEQGNVLQYVGLFSDITQLKLQQQRLEQLAHYDSLTGLPNRTLLNDRLYMAVESARRNNTKVTVVYLDLDDFKPVNDQYGHAAGDYLLEAIAERLTACVRRSDTVARIGGDEFVLLLLNESVNGYQVLLQRLQTELMQPVVLEGASMVISSSLGVAHFPTDADTPELLLRYADQAMYAAKQQGKNKVMEYRKLTN